MYSSHPHSVHRPIGALISNVLGWGVKNQPEVIKWIAKIASFWGFFFSVSDDLIDIEVISTASSDDFCVVPLPPCFNPDIPLNEDVGDDQEDSLESREDDQERDIPASPESAADPKVDELRERNLAEFSRSAPVPVKVANHVAEVVVKRGLQGALTFSDTPMTAREGAPRRMVSLPQQDNPVAPQPPSVERTPFVPGRLPASPPGRAVPVVQPRTSYPEPDLRRAISCPASVPWRPVDDVTGDVSGEEGGPETVRTQPPETMVVSRSTSSYSDSTGEAFHFNKVVVVTI